MSEQGHKSLRATLYLLGVALIVWYLFSVRQGETTIQVTKDTVIAQSTTIYKPIETRVIYHDTVIIHKVDTFYDLSECQAAYEELWKVQMGLLNDYHAERIYDTTLTDTSYSIRSKIRVQDNRLLSYELFPTIINTNTKETKYKYSLYAGLYTDKIQNQNSYGAMLTIPVRDLQFSVGRSFNSRGWFGSITTRIFSK